jgi:hypothetical protein
MGENEREKERERERWGSLWYRTEVPLSSQRVELLQQLMRRHERGVYALHRGHHITSYRIKRDIR